MHESTGAIDAPKDIKGSHSIDKDPKMRPLSSTGRVCVYHPVCATVEVGGRAVAHAFNGNLSSYTLPATVEGILIFQADELLCGNEVIWRLLKIAQEKGFGANRDNPLGQIRFFRICRSRRQLAESLAEVGNCQLGQAFYPPREYPAERWGTKDRPLHLGSVITFATPAEQLRGRINRNLRVTSPLTGRRRQLVTIEGFILDRVHTPEHRTEYQIAEAIHGEYSTTFGQILPEELAKKVHRALVGANLAQPKRKRK